MQFTVLVKMQKITGLIYRGKVEWRSWCLFIVCCIQILKVYAFEKLGQYVLSYRNQKHDQQWEKDPSNWNPGYPKTSKQVQCLE